ncbi:MAG: serine/threonine protein phosphatase [Planctomycetia bacterium]|nr:serine/threonine protein phosphatase [Planctomycetia bacterium]
MSATNSSVTPAPRAAGRVLAIGDIHGCLVALDALLELVRPRPDDLLVAVGDYVDRGPDSRGVIERLLVLEKTGRLVPLLGNHELMMLAARDNLDGYLTWVEVGGDQTLASYAEPGDVGRIELVPEDHWEFIERRCRPYYETDTHVFVHAALDPAIPLAEQTPYFLYWRKLDPWTSAHSSGKRVICGHTPQPSGLPANLGHTVGIDTWVYGEGWLTCLDVASNEVFQANQRGQARTLKLGG